jgi:hypothetical protein
MFKYNENKASNTYRSHMSQLPQTSSCSLHLALSPLCFKPMPDFIVLMLKFIFQVILCSCYSDSNEGLLPLQFNLWPVTKIHMLKDHITQVHLVSMWRKTTKNIQTWSTGHIQMSECLWLAQHTCHRPNCIYFRFPQWIHYSDISRPKHNILPLFQYKPKS